MKGELLAQIDPTGFESALQSAEGSLGEAYSVLDLARAEQERMEKMKGITPELVSDSMLERTREQTQAGRDATENPRDRGRRGGRTGSRTAACARPSPA